MMLFTLIMSLAWKRLGDATFLESLMRFYSMRYGTITPIQWKNLRDYVEGGGGFVPVHCELVFGNEPAFDQLVGGRFDSHKVGTFTAKVVDVNTPR